MRRVAVALLLVALACSRKTQLSSNLAVENKVAVRPVSLYYESPDMLLVPEKRNVALPQDPAAALPVVVQELIKGSANTGVPRLFPTDATVRAVYLLPDGNVLVDLGGETLTQGWSTGSHQELMAIYSLVQTVTANFAEARRVRILVNGAPAETLGGHISLAHSLAPFPALVDPRVH